jgi:UDP-GlcNAc3NAcA epimerase
MKKILNIIGARPQIIKASAITRELASGYTGTIKEIIVHTGQHYDDDMSGVFLREMDIPEPQVNLNVGSGSHAWQTAQIMTGLEKVIREEKPDGVIVYGDTNSTLAASITASKMNCPVMHVEAGLRSFRCDMPEEINRTVCDRLSTLLFCPTPAGIKNLRKEGISDAATPPYSPVHPGVFPCGDIMYDIALYHSRKAQETQTILADLTLEKESYVLVTIHRDFNTDIPERLRGLMESLLSIAKKQAVHVVLPLHPRTKKMLHESLDQSLFHTLEKEKRMHLLPPQSYLAMIQLEQHCQMVLTDSGGVQKEAYFFHKPCIVLRKETEWVEQVDNGTTLLADADPEMILYSFHYFSGKHDLQFPSLYGDGKTASFICRIMEEFLYF